MLLVLKTKKCHLCEKVSNQLCGKEFPTDVRQHCIHSIILPPDLTLPNPHCISDPSFLPLNGHGLSLIPWLELKSSKSRQVFPLPTHLLKILIEKSVEHWIGDGSGHGHQVTGSKYGQHQALVWGGNWHLIMTINNLLLQYLPHLQSYLMRIVTWNGCTMSSTKL